MNIRAKNFGSHLEKFGALELSVDAVRNLAARVQVHVQGYRTTCCIPFTGGGPFPTKKSKDTSASTLICRAWTTTAA
jgi:hypothetical protein